MQWISALVAGLGLGSMYGLMALGFHLTFAVSATVNFAQGSSMMLGAVLAYTFAQTLGWPMPLAIAAALALCAVYGLVVERLAVQPFVRRGSSVPVRSRGRLRRMISRAACCFSTTLTCAAMSRR